MFETNRRVVLGSRLLAVRGKLQREGLVTHVVARSFTDLTPQLVALANGHDLGDAVLARADEGRSGRRHGRPRNAANCAGARRWNGRPARRCPAAAISIELIGRT